MLYVIDTHIRQPYKLPNHYTILQAEVFAVNLYIDSQAAIKGITAYKVNSKLVNSWKASYKPKAAYLLDA